jgi:hypothetical protein
VAGHPDRRSRGGRIAVRQQNEMAKLTASASGPVTGPAGVQGVDGDQRNDDDGDGIAGPADALPA